MNTTTPILTNSPLGNSHHPIPHAAMCSTYTSKELIRHTDQDAAYFRQLEQFGVELNKPQIEAVRHGQGPLLTLAGAGSGKTSVLVCRTGYLVSVRHVDPRRILLVTFSSKAATEMRERITKLPSIRRSDANSIQAQTFHSLFLRLLRAQGNKQDIYSETLNQHLILKIIMRRMGIQNSAYQPENLLTLLSSYKMNLVDINKLPVDTDTEKEIKQIFIQYEEWKTANNKIDFDDILLLAYQMLENDPSLLANIQQRFEYVMVDEFQDTNCLQYKLIQMLVQPHHNLMVVGDDDQTIYSFNGARSEFILDFGTMYPEARTITLDINYRSTTSIVGLGNEVIKHNQARAPKTLQASRTSELIPRYMRPSHADEEAAFILKQISTEVEQGRRRYGDYAILYRTTSYNRAILEQLVLQGIPYLEYGDGLMLYEHWLIKPVIHHMRLALNKRDFDALESVVASLYINRDKGMTYIHQQELKQKKKGPLAHLLTYPELKDFQKEKVKERLALIRNLPIMKPLEAIKLIRTSFYDTFIEANERSPITEHKEMLKETLDELEASAKRFGTIEEFLAFVNEITSKKQQTNRSKHDAQEDRIVLMTIHKSKGLEFPSVFLIGAVEGCLPHSSAIDAGRMKQIPSKQKEQPRTQAAIEEERRLAYVAITRAQEELTISSPMYYRGGKAEISRFITSAFQADSSNNLVDAWICSSETCNAWSRISSQKEAELPDKACPLCQAPMVKGSKEVPR